MSLAKNLELAKLAVSYVRDYALPKGADNRWFSDNIVRGANHKDLKEMRAVFRMRKQKGIGGIMEDAPEKTIELPKIRLKAYLAKLAQIGNCGEHSAIAFLYLHEAHRVKPLDWMQYLKPDDHAWVVIGRRIGSDHRDYRTWGDEAVICDPWNASILDDIGFSHSAFPARDMSRKLYGYGGAKYRSYCAIEN